MSDVISNDGSEAQLKGQGANRVFQVSLIKAEHHYTFRYELEAEQEIVKAILKMAKDPSNDLSTTDALVLSHQIGRNKAAILEKQDAIWDQDTHK
jgi:hypothetical protein